MKQWINANIIELEISKTEHNRFGYNWGGGHTGGGYYFGGHHGWSIPVCKPTSPTPTPCCHDTDPLS
jgi:hypothetical protein